MAALLDKDIIEFQRLYRRHFGVDITKEQALEKGYLEIVAVKPKIQPK